jgi:hypothetical protein
LIVGGVSISALELSAKTPEEEFTRFWSLRVLIEVIKSLYGGANSLLEQGFKTPPIAYSPPIGTVLKEAREHHLVLIAK